MSIKPGFRYGMPVLGNTNQFNSGWQRDLDRVLKSAVAGGASWSGNVHFGSTGAQSFSDFSVQFPAKSAPVGTTCPILGTPQPPPSTCFTAHVLPFDVVVIRFNNYGASPQTVSSQVFSLVLIPQAQN